MEEGVDYKTSVIKDPKYNYGGQQSGMPPHLVRVEHIDTGIVAICGYERTQHKNRKTAIAMIEYGLAELEY